MVLAIQQKSTNSSQLLIFGLCVLFRSVNAYLTRTYDNPDEYWQGQEVAHNMVFGYGYLTWEWREKIRSFAHPLTIALVYKVIQLVGLDHTFILVAAPRYFQATLGAIADFATYSLAKKIFGNDIALPVVKKNKEQIERRKDGLILLSVIYNFMLLVQLFNGSAYFIK
jgi:phosphatidylinositol glycan class B